MLKKYTILLDPAATAPSGGQPAAPAPSPAPAAAPAAPAPAGGTAPAAPASPAPADDPFSAFDAEFTKPAEPKDAKAGAKPAPGKKPDPAAAKPDEKTKEPKQLRERLDVLEKELKAKNDSMTGLQAKLAELEAKNKDTAAVTARIQELEKQIADKEGELRRAEFKTSDDFAKNYEKPWNRMTTAAQREIETLKVGEYREDEMSGEKTWVPIRAANWAKDFAAIYQLDRPEARKRAEALFGPEAVTVMENYISLKRFQSEMNDALETERSDWQKSRETERAERVQREEGFRSACEAAQRDYEAKFPNWYKDDPADPKTGEMLKQGWSLVNMKPASFQQAVILNTRNRMNAAAAPMLQYRLTQLQAQLDEARGTIDKLKSSKPGQTQRSGEPAKEPDISDEKEWAQAAREAMMK